MGFFRILVPAGTEAVRFFGILVPAWTAADGCFKVLVPALTEAEGFFGILVPAWTEAVEFSQDSGPGLDCKKGDFQGFWSWLWMCDQTDETVNEIAKLMYTSVIGWKKN